MEKAIIKTLLEKYWQAETTVEEEQALAAYFRQETIDPELQPYGDLFAYFGEEQQVTAGPGFDERILQRLGIADASSLAPDDAHSTATVRTIRPFSLGLIAAAAAIAALIVGLFLLTPPVQRNVLATVDQPARPAEIKDTYDDPQQALAAVRHALLIASTHLNEGRQQLTGGRK